MKLVKLKMRIDKFLHFAFRHIYSLLEPDRSAYVEWEICQKGL
ncbi:hypothetical protein CFII68_20683 [Pseudomonas sp. CFII68]|nr:hypothetical protein CFII68_20683 [Pseudomonas sp. CFII68]